MKLAILLTMLLHSLWRSAAWSVGSRTCRRHLQVLRMSTTRDDDGRIIRTSSSKQQSGGSSWDDFDAWDAKPAPSSPQRGGGWDDDDDGDDRRRRGRRPERPQRSSGARPNRNSRGSGGFNDRSRNDRGGGFNDRSHNDRRGGFNDRNSRGGDRNSFNKYPPKPDADKRINMKALEGAGFDHLYGLASCLNALQANVRDLRRPEDLIDLSTLEGEELEHEQKQRDRKPEAQFSPYLFCQSMAPGASNRNTSKAQSAHALRKLAEERNIPVAEVDKGALNTLSQNRPHQGYVLRCGKISFDPITQLEPEIKLWLCLDEVVDPQNLGALLRSAHFLGSHDIGVVVCAKNSAPPSPVVSAASAGALEVMDIHSTSNLPKLLHQAAADDFDIVGASSSIPTGDDDAELFDLTDLTLSVERPTVLVLGSEGHGLRTLVAKACTAFVRIPGGGGGSEESVDSLNVSVTGGILLWHLLNSKK